MSSNCIWLQIIFCSCVNETTLSPSCDHSCVKMADCFTDLSKSHLWSNHKTIIKKINLVIAKYRDLSVSQISRYFAQPCPIIVNYFQKVEYHKCCTTWSFSGLNCLYFQTFSLNKTNLDREQTLPSMKGFPQPQKSPRKEFCHTHLQQDQLMRMGCFLFLWLYSNCNITELLVALNDSCVCSHTCQEECFALDNTVKW